MDLIVFDREGLTWDASSRRLTTLLESSIQGEQLADYAVKNLGFVAARAIGNSAHIRVRPAVVTLNALGALHRWLVIAEPQRLLISWFEKDWNYRLVAMSNEGSDALRCDQWRALMRSAAIARTGTLG